MLERSKLSWALCVQLGSTGFKLPVILTWEESKIRFGGRWGEEGGADLDWGEEPFYSKATSNAYKVIKSQIKSTSSVFETAEIQEDASTFEVTWVY